MATEAALRGCCQSSWIPEACLYSNPFLLLRTAANLPSLPQDQALLIPLANHWLWTALEWTPSRPTRATPITPAAPGDQTDMGMFPVCLPCYLTVCFCTVTVSSHVMNLFLPDYKMLTPALALVLWSSAFSAHWVCCVCLLFERLTCWLNKWDERLRERQGGNKREIETDRACGLGSSQLNGSNLFQWFGLFCKWGNHLILLKLVYYFLCYRFEGDLWNNVFQQPGINCFSTIKNALMVDIF